MKEKTAQTVLYNYLEKRGLKLACPNYTPLGWWECDLFTVTPADMFVEYEIKLTRADFFHDQEKKPQDWKSRMREARGDEVLTKHARLERKDTQGPSRFFFVTPKGLLKPEEIPPWAGLIEIDRAGSPRYGFRWSAGECKKAPQLHRDKVNPKVVEHCHSVFYYRFWNLRRKFWPCDIADPVEDQRGALV